MNEQIVLHRPFDIETHKKTFINYLEVVIDGDGKIMYAVPSHQEKLVRISCESLKLSREALYSLCPREYYCDFMTWLCKISNCVSVWNEFITGTPNEKQKQALKILSEAGLYKG